MLKKMCTSDGKDKYFHPTGIKDVDIFFYETACRTLNSVSRMITRVIRKKISERNKKTLNGRSLIELNGMKQMTGLTVTMVFLLDL
jgi:hypothetical protein